MIISAVFIIEPHGIAGYYPPDVFAEGRTFNFFSI